MPRGFKTPDFATFFGEDGKSTMEHIQRFTVQCSEGNQNKFHKLQMNLKQQVDELVVNFIERLKKMFGKCSI
jgi:hypothetical protein